jgi:pimeloyl-ACP methyl ester carboxylesterase
MRRGAALANFLSWLPVKEFGLLSLDALGVPAWENMRRRTKTMFARPYDKDWDKTVPVGPLGPRQGAAAMFFDSLQRVSRDSRHHVEISLLGHSMGAIVANEALRTHDSLEVRNVVFLAGALTLREFQQGTLPYLEHHPQSQFYNVTLHPFSEVREKNLGGLAPDGSLLMWLGSYLSDPESELDLIMGDYVYLVTAGSIFPEDLRNRVHIKAYGYRDGMGCGPKGMPFMHGHFSERDVPIWRPAFWMPGVRCPSLNLPVSAGGTSKPQ